MLTLSVNNEKPLLILDFIRPHKCKHIYVDPRTHKHTHTRMHIHTHRHTHIHTDVGFSVFLNTCFTIILDMVMFQTAFSTEPILVNVIRKQLLF